jgi:hypothetical protein
MAEEINKLVEAIVSTVPVRAGDTAESLSARIEAVTLWFVHRLLDRVV